MGEEAQMITSKFRPIVTGPLFRYRFRFRANGKEHEVLIDAPSYPEACYSLALVHRQKLFRRGRVPKDFEIDLRNPELVET
ncbi:MAG: hypothetical protein QOE70_4355 [Chthoniobacter sp.]|jgi:hypothetical protein|nr:hypothetical protein [Chthoniobacter sp.]